MLFRSVVTKVWFEVFALLVIAFLPTIAARTYAGVKMSASILPTIQQLFSGGQPDLGQLIHAFQQLALRGFSISFLSRVVLLLNLPLALGALMYAYENLFGPRTASVD